MEIDIQLTRSPIAENFSPPAGLGAWVEFRGVVRAEENGASISALVYEAYPEMTGREIRRLLEDISERHPCLAARVFHRLGVVPVGETAIYVGVASRHRAEAFALLGEFMDRLKQDVPIWKRRAVEAVPLSSKSNETTLRTPPHIQSLDEAIEKIQARCQFLPAERVPLAKAFGRVLRKTVCATGDLPPFDCATRDGFAILADDPSEHFHVVDTIHAAGWQPRQLKSGEAVRVATGAMLPCGGLRVVMQENVERHGDLIKVSKSASAPNVRRRGAEVKAGATLVPAGTRLNAGRLALLATAGCVQPLVSPRLRVAHFTTGDEIIPPDQTPQPGQIRDCNTILTSSLLQPWPCEIFHTHLPENFARAKQEIENQKAEIERADLVLVSGGASVGERDFTRPLLEWLGFETIFSQVNLRPGKPLIFGVNGSRVAFGLPGNPLSHFVCFYLAVATALARLSGESTPAFLRGRLATQLDEPPCPRETLWPAKLEYFGGEIRLQPLVWSSSGDVACFAAANALLRVPANQSPIAAGAEVDFLPATSILGT
jgi:molybdopterin molybdotransferase